MTFKSMAAFTEEERAANLQHIRRLIGEILGNYKVSKDGFPMFEKERFNAVLTAIDDIMKGRRFS